MWRWNEFDHLDTNRQPLSFPDWTHTNAVIYSADDGNLIISIRNWFYAQHGPSFVTSNTTGKFSLVLFDNGDDRVFASGVTCGDAGQPPCLFSTVPLLELDETAKTATVAFHPTTPDYSFFGGNAETLKNGNVEYAECGATSPANNAAINEVTQTSPPQTVWQMKIAGQYAFRGMRIPGLYPGVQW